MLKCFSWFVQNFIADHYCVVRYGDINLAIQSHSYMSMFVGKFSLGHEKILNISTLRPFVIAFSRNDHEGMIKINQHGQHTLFSMSILKHEGSCTSRLSLRGHKGVHLGIRRTLEVI